MDVSALPHEVKQQLLERIRQQVGSDSYRELVRQFGEDGLLSQVLEATSAAVEKTRPSVWKRAWDMRLFEVVGFITTPLWLFAGNMQWDLKGCGWLVLNFFCFFAFASIVGAGSGRKVLDEQFGYAFGLGLCITGATYLCCVVIAAMSGHDR